VREPRSVVIVGSRRIEMATAVRRVVEYFNEVFKTYDAYRTNDHPNVLASSDLLPPLLLNVRAPAIPGTPCDELRRRLTAR
jgi:hypothetical protein